MQWIKSTIFCYIVFISFSINAQSDQESSIALGLNTGYNGGFGVQLSATALKPLQSLPVQLRFGLAIVN